MSKEQTAIKALFSICLMLKESLDELETNTGDPDIRYDLSHIQEELDRLGELLYPKEKD